MATIEVSEGGLRRAASGEVFARVVEMVDAAGLAELRESLARAEEAHTEEAGVES